ncbi:hypothetical protein [Vulgatibacter incomptus]|uniref:hypothetical protein n=1 Tax=Vulgatibacter incomptus TaxID=1391653 RepID=UPI001F0ACFE0|nr:hypothetical protein [Vulgatibacter incomptus]
MASRHPVHVTLRVLDDVWNLRSRRCFRVIEAALFRGSNRLGLRLTHYSVQGNHLHLIVEARDTQALSRGTQGLSVRIARSLNRLMGRRGKVFADRFHSHVLRTPREARNAIHYVLGNARIHARRQGRSTSAHPDPYAAGPIDGGASSALRSVVPPRTWLLRVGWRVRSDGGPAGPA